MRFLVCLGLLVTAHIAVADLTSVDESTVFVAVYDDGLKKVKGGGSGFFVSSEGHLITNHHVIESGDKFFVAGPGIKSKGRVSARVLWSNKRLDLALMKITSKLKEFPKGLPLFSQAVPKTIDVYSYGYPGTLFINAEVFDSEIEKNLDPTATKGIVSRVLQSKESGEMVQHTAEIRKGNSGGPLVNDCGVVVGVNVSFMDFSKLNDSDIRGTDYFAVSVAELINAMGDRVPGLKMTSSCEGAGVENKPITRVEEPKAQIPAVPPAESQPESSVPESLPQKPKYQEERTIPPKAREGREPISNETLALMAFFTLIVIVGFFALRKNEERAPELVPAVSTTLKTDSSLPESETYQQLLKLSGFDQNGSPLSLNIQDNSILRGRGYVVGRSRAFSDLAINHEKISRAHVHFTYENGSVYAADLNSTNGTFLNGIQVQAFKKTRVNPSDELRLADIILAISR